MYETSFDDIRDVSDDPPVSRLIADKIRAAEHFLGEMHVISGSDSMHHTGAPIFKYNFDSFLNQILSVNSYYKRESSMTFDRWISNSWADDLHNHLRKNLRNPINHPNEWTDEVLMGLARNLVVVRSIPCFPIDDLPDSFVDYYLQNEYPDLDEKQSRLPPTMIPVTDICRIYLEEVICWIEDMEDIDYEDYDM